MAGVIESQGKTLFDSLPVDEHVVADVVNRHWHAKVGDRIKASQNHTFRATDKDGNAVFVRVTPDPNNEQHQRIQDELHLIMYLHDHGLEYVCRPIANAFGQMVVKHEDLVIVMFEHATGHLVDFAKWEWISDQTFAFSWGRWTGQLHNLTKKYAVDFPEVVGRMRRWDELHDGVMSGVPVDPADQALVSDPNHYGVLHGDLNISNFFWIDPKDGETYGKLSVFDWDQAQLGWFMYDLAVVVWFPYMLSSAGTFMDGSAVPGKEAYEQFRAWVIDGYDSVQPDGQKLDPGALDRMVMLRRAFNDRFCHRALRELAELETTNPAKVQELAFMKVFMEWVAGWIDRDNAQQA